MARILRMPEVLAGAAEATITSWEISEGDRFEPGTVLAEIETDKAVVDFSLEEEGWIGRLLVPNGTTVEVGEPIAILLSFADESPDDVTSDSLDVPKDGVGSSDGASVDSVPGDASIDATSADNQPAIAPVPQEAGTRVFASPLARKLARDRGIPIESLTGTGPGGRIVRADVERATAATQSDGSTTESASAEKFPRQVGDIPQSVEEISHSVEEIPHSRMRLAIARRLTESKSTVPHFYMKVDCRVDELLEVRSRVNAVSPAKVSVNDFVIKAVAAAFAEVPEANAIWTDSAMKRFSTVDVAVAVATETDLVTPVVRGVENLSITDLAHVVRDLADRAREKKLKQHELEGGSFTVSNLGMFGITEFSAILNPPHSGILAVGAARPVPIALDGEVTIAQIMTCTLSADHRAVDGALAARWIAAFQKAIEAPFSLLV